MFDEPSLTKALAEIGYRRVKEHVYRAEWSSDDVEHFIYLQLYGYPLDVVASDFLTAHFGIRNKDAQLFAVQSLKTYGSKSAQLIRHDDTDCPMRFELGRLAGDWGLLDSFALSQVSGFTVASKVRDTIKYKVFPAVRHVVNVNRLLAFLLADAEPCPWIRCNGALRAGMIVDLAHRLGMEQGVIEEALKPYLERIGMELRRAPNPDPQFYVRRIIEDSFNEGLARNDRS